MNPVVFADNGSWKVCMNTLVGQIDRMFAFMETQTQTTPCRKFTFPPFLRLVLDFFLFCIYCYLYSFVFKISVLSSILKSAQKQERVTCNSLQNSPLFSQSVLKGAKYRRRLCKINRVFFASLPSLIRFLASLQTFPLTVRAHRQLPSNETRRKHAKVIMDKTDRLHFLGDQQFLVHGRCTQRSQNVVTTKLNSRIPLLFPYDSRIPTQLKQETPLPLIIKIPASSSFFSSHLEYHHQKQPNPAFRQTFCGPFLLGVDLQESRHPLSAPS